MKIRRRKRIGKTMKEILTNPVSILVEKELLVDAINIIGSGVNKIFSHNEIESVKARLLQKLQESQLAELPAPTATAKKK